MDEDPASVQPPYLDQVELLSVEHDISVCEDRKRKNRVIILKPRFEEWLIKTAMGADLSLEAFGLSSKPNELHREINSRIRSLEKLIERLIELKDKRVLYLKKQLGL